MDTETDKSNFEQEFSRVNISDKNQKWYVKAFIMTPYVKDQDHFMVDKKNIEYFVDHLKTNLQIKDIVKVDLTREEMKDEFEKILKDEEKFDYTHIMFIFSAHGNVNIVKCSDSKEFKWIEQLKTLNSKSEKFRNMQKVIIIDTCQGKMKDLYYEEDGRPVPNSSPLQTVYENNCLDLENHIYCFSTLEGYITNMSPNGSIYLRCLFFELLSNAYKKENSELQSNLSDILYETNYNISRYEYRTANDNMDILIGKQMSCYFSTLLKPLVISFKEKDQGPTSDDLRRQFDMDEIELSFS